MQEYSHWCKYILATLQTFCRLKTNSSLIEFTNWKHEFASLKSRHHNQHHNQHHWSVRKLFYYDTNPIVSSYELVIPCLFQLPSLVILMNKNTNRRTKNRGGLRTRLPQLHILAIHSTKTGSSQGLTLHICVTVHAVDYCLNWSNSSSSTTNRQFSDCTLWYS